MWWRARYTDRTVDPVQPLYSAFSFVEEDPFPDWSGNGRSPKGERESAALFPSENDLPDVTLPTAVLQAVRNGDSRLPYATYDSNGQPEQLPSPNGLHLNMDA